MSRIWICFLMIFTCLCNGCRSVQTATEPMAVSAQPIANRREVIRMLVLGKDRAAGLTDGILIVSFDVATADLSVLQIPRDTYAEYSSRNYMKLNGAYNALGMEGTKEFLSDALGISIDYALVLDLDCVADMVDAVGGVEVEVTQPMQYEDPYQNLVIDLEPGVHRLDGRTAEHFLRFRSGYANADLGRMDAQKRFIRAFLNQCTELNAASLAKLVWKLLPRVETDIPIHRAFLVSRIINSCQNTDIPMETAPGEAVLGVSGAWYYSLNRAGMIRVVRSNLLAEDYRPSAFDPDGKFDRIENSDFHNIYIAPDRGS